MMKPPGADPLREVVFVMFMTMTFAQTGLKVYFQTYQRPNTEFFFTSSMTCMTSSASSSFTGNAFPCLIVS